MSSGGCIKVCLAQGSEKGTEPHDLPEISSKGIPSILLDIRLFMNISCTEGPDSKFQVYDGAQT